MSLETTGKTATAESAEPAPRAPNNRAAKIRQDQEQALKTLTRYRLYISLYIRGDPPKENDFHWSLYYHNCNPTTGPGGTKYHITGGDPVWTAEHGRVGNLFKDFLLCVVVEIGTVPDHAEDKAEAIFKSFDPFVNDKKKLPSVTCRTWLMMVVQELANANLVYCQDIRALERECMDAGNMYMASAAENRQPRPLIQARTCGYG